MKRHAILIEGSEVTGEAMLPGAKADVATYRRWLESSPGGLWYSNEIRDLHTPTVAQVRKAVAEAGEVGYAFVAFSGHGFHSFDLDETKICLRDGNIAVRELILETDRTIIVIDACRKVMPEIFAESHQLSANAQLRYKKAVGRNYRKEFESLVSSGEKGQIFMFSCDLDEAAAESPRGGYFSRFLVEAGEGFASENPDGKYFLPTSHAFQQSAAATTGRNRTQHPQYHPGRRLNHFPFAI